MQNWLPEANGLTTMQTIKESAKEVVDHLPDNCNWDDVMYTLYVKRKIDQGIKASEEGRVVSHEEAKQRMLSRFTQQTS